MPEGGKRWLACVALQALGAASLAGGDLTGMWIGTIPQRDRTPARDLAFRFAQHGNELRGKAYTNNGPSATLREGAVTNGTLRFTVEAREQAGNQINIVEFRFNGKIADGKINMVREKVSARNAVSGAAVPLRRPWDTDEEDRARRFRSFTLERLFR